jgi:hypothetical protein
MTLRLFIHSASKRVETSALLDSGAMENFMHLDYAKALGLPSKSWRTNANSTMWMEWKTKLGP